MSAPIVSIKEISSTRLSNKVDKNICNITFTFDQDVQAFTVNVMGSSYDTGTVAESEYYNVGRLKNLSISELKALSVKEIRQIDLDTDIVAVIDSSELYQEGNNRINVYGQNLNGEWNLYE